MGRELVKYTKDGKEITFKYDENGLRHRKTITENGVITEQYDYVWSDGTLISQTYTDLENGTVVSTNTARFIYDSWGTLQGFILNDSETYLYVKNLQGDIIAIVDELGEVIVEYSYDAWGNVTFSESSLQNMTKASTLCFVSPFTYRGYCYDYDIELYYLQSRYYSAEIGRFINTDDTQIAIATMGTVLGANLFAYCENNPVMNVDYTGYAATLVVAGITFTIGELIAIVSIFYFLVFYTCNIGGFRTLVNNAIIWALDSLVTSVNSIANRISKLGKSAAQRIGKKFSELKQSVSKAIAKLVTRLTTITATKTLPKIAKGYGLFKCKEAANAMKKELIKKKLPGKYVDLYFPDAYNGYITSDRLGGNTAISENKHHYGILFNGKIYCNIYPEGLPAKVWPQKFHAASDKKIITYTPF